MRRGVCAGLLVLIMAGCPHPGPRSRPEPPGVQATWLLHNGVIFTARDTREVTDALAVAGERILAAGAYNDLRRFVGPQTRVVDLGGHFVCPGFHDAHLHLESGGRALAAPSFFGVTSLDEVLARVAREVARTAPGEWITGGGWDHTLWPGQRWPTRQDLDRVAPDHPVLLSRVDGHAVWVNSKALALAGVDARTRSPRGGEIPREPGGFPSGILKEAAMQLVRPALSTGQVERHLLLALAEARRNGITSLQDIDSSLEQLIRLREAGKLTSRVHKMGRLADGPAAWEALRRGLPRDGLLMAGALKGFVDGTLGSSTAALLEPYGDRPDSTGTLSHTRPELDAMVAEATRRRFQVALHAIGDRAVRQALRAIDAALPLGSKALRHRVEHAQVVHPDDLAAFARTGAVASIQPCHLVTDQRWVEQRLGAERARQRGYLWRALGERTVVALGTDWPVEPLSPLRNLYAAVTRRQIGPRSGSGWHPEQRLTIGQALRAYTWGSGFAAFAEGRRGTLEAGRDADLVVLDRDLLRATPEQLLETRVVATMLAGQVVHGSLRGAR